MFSSLTPKRIFLYLVLITVMIISQACSLGGAPGANSSNVTAATPVPGAVVGDYGDAPDGDHNMDTGYYAPTGGPFLFTYTSAGVAGNFPTMGDDPIPGAYTVDVDEFWIGPLFGGSDADIPSLENDADAFFRGNDGVGNIHFFSVDQDFAVRHSFQPGNGPQSGCFAAARLAQHHNKFTIFNGQIQILEHLITTKEFLHIAHLNLCHQTIPPSL